ncbi:PLASMODESMATA CALLOSE-BINDING PROTEIN 3-like isoform X2 [Miscanthus floridulus]|uniref:PLASMODESMATA CALLOSE-BINDING PROTEIN 3-like isoform X2 n=1 Tax=Miscanthus floridulus TaxID=154761 RepID=UPI00345A2411
MADSARLFLLVAVAAALAGRSDGAWCVCRTDLADSALQKTLDYACGGGADCKPILQNGACFAPDTVKAHCSYAVNSFYQRNNQNPQACVFSGTATLSNNDPSGNGCTYPATPRLFSPATLPQTDYPKFIIARLRQATAAYTVLPRWVRQPSTTTAVPPASFRRPDWPRGCWSC